MFPPAPCTQDQPWDLLCASCFSVSPASFPLGNSSSFHHVKWQSQGHQPFPPSACASPSPGEKSHHSPVAEIQLSPAELSRTSYGHLDSTVLEVNLNTPQMYDKTHPPYLPPLCWLNVSLVACNWVWNSTEINHYKAREWGRSHTYLFAYMGGSRYTDNSICKQQQLSSNLSIKSSPSERPRQWKSVNQRCLKIARVKC